MEGREHRTMQITLDLWSLPSRKFPCVHVERTSLDLSGPTLSGHSIRMTEYDHTKLGQPSLHRAPCKSGSKVGSLPDERGIDRLQ